MSRIGKQPIAIPKGVEIKISPESIDIKGPKGQLSVAANPLTEAKVEDGQLLIDRKNDGRDARAAHGLVRALCANATTGVSDGFERKLEINGTGYRCEVKGKSLTLSLGFSHPIDYPLPEGVSAKFEGKILTLSGIDKEALGAAAAKIRSYRPPEPYKGKGVKYLEEHITRKQGKAAG